MSARVEQPRVSVVIPTYNSCKCIEGTLLSVFRQTFQPFEIIVSDDGSDDDTVKIVERIFETNKEIKTTLVKNQHSGPGANRNRAIEGAQGEWIAFLDSDDEWYPNKLAVVVEYMMKDLQNDLWCHSEVMRKGKKEEALEYFKRFSNNIHPFLSLYRDNALSTSAVVVKKAMVEKAGKFDETLPSAQDYDLWLRIAQYANIGFIEETLGVYNIRSGSISSDPTKRLNCLVRIAKKNDSAVKAATKFWFFEQRNFLARCHMSCGLIFCSQKKIGKGIKYILRSMLYWPFRWDLEKAVIRKLKKKS